MFVWWVVDKKCESACVSASKYWKLEHLGRFDNCYLYIFYIYSFIYVFPLVIYLFIYLFIHLFIYLFIYPCVCMFLRWAVLPES